MNPGECTFIQYPEKEGDRKYCGHRTQRKIDGTGYEELCPRHISEQEKKDASPS